MSLSIGDPHILQNLSCLALGKASIELYIFVACMETNDLISQNSIQTPPYSINIHSVVWKSLYLIDAMAIECENNISVPIARI